MLSCNHWTNWPFSFCYFRFLSSRLMAWCFLLVFFVTEKVTVSERRLKENFWFMWNCKKAVFFGIVCFLKTVIHFLVVFAKGILVRAISFSDFITQTKFCGWIAICCISLFYPLVLARPARGRHYLGKIFSLPTNIFIVNNKLYDSPLYHK